MKVKRYIKGTITALLTAAVLTTGSASAWDFDKTRAADIVDRAANDGNDVAKLLLAMALDEWVTTIFDDYQFRLPANRPGKQLHVSRLDAMSIYQSLMPATGPQTGKESLTAYSLLGAYALADRNFSRATVYYRTAEIIGERLIQENGMKPDLMAVTQDVRAGTVAAMRCNDVVPEQDTTYKIEKFWPVCATPTLQVSIRKRKHLIFLQV